MRTPLKTAIAAALVALASIANAQEHVDEMTGPKERDPNGPPPVIKGVNDKPTPEQERQFFLGMVSLRDFCKEAMPEKSEAVDEVWNKSVADVPEAIVAYSKTDAFANLLKMRMMFLRAVSKRTEGMANLKAACEKMTAAQ